jgi:thiamine biosynthesis lipoprotein
MKTGKTTQPRFDRRRLLQIVAVAGAAGVGWTLGLHRRAAGFKMVQKSQPMMGTILNVKLYGPEIGALEEAVQDTIGRMLALEKKLSRHDPASEIATLNRTGRLDAPSPETVAVLRMANRLSEKTDGAFDVTVLPLLHLRESGGHTDPAAVADALERVGHRHLRIAPPGVTLAKTGMGVTLDGIGKGYIVDAGITTLKERGFQSCYLEAGGDLMVTGDKPGDRPWRIGIRNPRQRDTRHMVVLKTANRAIATSGDYMQAYTPNFREHHIVNPRTGYSPPELASATITAPSVALADGLATAAMVMGHEKAIALLDSLAGCAGYFIDKELNHYQSNSFSV